MMIDRRALLGGIATLAVLPHGSLARTLGDIIPIGDMHAHLFFVGPKPASVQPLRRNMASGGAVLVSWSLVGDMPWLKSTSSGLKQSGAPKSGSGTSWLEEELKRVKAHLAEQQIKVVTTPADLDKALAGELHVVLSVEGATFLDDGIEGLERAHAAGIRHVQLVHYVRNQIGDFQTEAPTHGGLTDFGKKVIQEANRLGMLVDLAHATTIAVGQALEVSNAPMVWSHSSIARGTPEWRMVPWRARQLRLAEARAIAAKGGVVGLWALRSDVGDSIEAYADRLLEMADAIGDEHVAFGTDMNALSGTPVRTYADLRRAVDYLADKGVDRERLRKMAIGNYVRVLRTAMAAGKV